MSKGVAVITHAAREDDELSRRLRADGARIIEMPCITIEPLVDIAPLEDAIAQLGPNDWLVVTSPAGADAIARVAPSRSRIAAIGDRTAVRLAHHGRRASFVPSVPNGRTLARELPPGGRVLLARSDRALADAPRILRERGFEVVEVVAYHTRVGATGDVAAVRDVLAQSGERVAIYVESPSALEGLRAAIEPELLAKGVITHVAHR